MLSLAFSLSLFTIRRACEAVKRLFSLGGLPEDDGVGLRLRCFMRFAEVAPMEALFIALLIRSASPLSVFHEFSRSELELLPLSSGVMSLDIVSTWRRAERLPALLGSISLRGEWSESEENCESIGGRGEPSVFFAKNPALKRLFLALGSR